MFSSFSLTFSNNTLTVLPTNLKLASLAYLFITSFNVCNLLFFSSIGTSSFILAAGVPSLGEYINVNAESYLHSRASFNVSSKSQLVSPGKPTIISVVIDEDSPNFSLIFL